MKKFIRIPLLAASVAAMFMTVSCSRDNSSSSAAVKGAPADAARITMENQVNAFKNGDLKALYLTLPASYQKDISSVVKAAAGKLDADLYKAGAGLLVSFAEIGESNSKLLAEMSPDEDKKVTAAEIKSAAVALKGLAKKLTLDTLKKGDVDEILSYKEVTDVFKLVQKNMPMPVTEVTGSEENEDGSVTVYFKDKDGDEDEADYISVNGVWVPEEIAGDWDETIKGALESIAEFELDADTKEQIMSLIPTLKTSFETLKKAKTKDEFQMGVASAYMMMMMGGGGATFDFGEDDEDEDDE